MKVRALKTISTYYTLEKGRVYDVYAVLFIATKSRRGDESSTHDNNEIKNFINPLYSLGNTSNEAVYVIETYTETGRKTHMRFDMSNFEVVDASVPEEWSAGEVDLRNEALRYIEQVNNTNLAAQLKEVSGKVLVIGDRKMLDPEYLFAICDDNMD